MATGHALIQRFANRFVNPQLAANQRGRSWHGSAWRSFDGFGRKMRAGLRAGCASPITTDAQGHP
jgi:hypothetical protein